MNMSSRHSGLVLLAVLVGVGACGPTKYRMADPTNDGRDRPCVIRVDTDTWRKGNLTPHLCAAWTDRTDFDIIDTAWTYFPHLLLGSESRYGRDCPDCWLEVQRPSRRDGGNIWRLSLHIPPDDQVAAIYVGEYKEGLFEGEGTLSLTRVAACERYCRDFFVADGGLADSLTLQGTWSEGFLPSETGFRAEWVRVDGTEYRGEAVHDPVGGVLPHGEGVRTSADGAVYEGAFRRGKRHGTGTMTRAGGTTYVGAYVGGRREGVGTLTLPDGSVYQGDFRDGQRFGEGEQVYADGVIYQGEWANDAPHGEGVRTDEHGVRRSGQWLAGELQPDDVAIAWPDGTTYQGTVRDGQPRGQGVMEWPTGERYIGAWDHGRMTSFGQLTWSDGHSFTGTWHEGRPDGCGLHRDAEGELFVGTWSHGVPIAIECSPDPSWWPADTLERIDDESLSRNSLVRAYWAQRRSRTARTEAEALRITLAPRYATVLPDLESEQPTESIDDSEVALPRAVRVAFAWPAERQQRMVHPSCLIDGALRMSVDGERIDTAVGGVVDAEAAMRLMPGTTPKVCAVVDGPCGGGAGCVPIDVPVEVPEEAGSLAVRVRILLEPDEEPAESLVESAVESDQGAPDAPAPPSDAPTDGPPRRADTDADDRPREGKNGGKKSGSDKNGRSHDEGEGGAKADGSDTRAVEDDE